ncbi:MAG: ClpXP protease specificity-enhancing factor [Gammaproteobacteria bacterium]|nr:ClpXP protease specificity-enhancing factor [Gammaproteobacteria bacterium]
MNQLKPYLLRATRDWCLDNGLTPHLLVDANVAGVVVPTSHIEDGKIVLNTSPRAIQAFDIDDAGVRFAARFGGKEFFVEAPLNAVLAIYAKENGQGITFPPEAASATNSTDGRTSAASRASDSSRGPRLDPTGEAAGMPTAKAGTPPSKEPPPGKPPRKGPALKIVK